MDADTFAAFLTALRDEVPCTISGSFARGEQDARPGFLSDVDLVCPDESGEDRPISRAVEVFGRFGVPWDSAIVGSISSPRDTSTLPRPVEVSESMWITDSAPNLDRVNAGGVEFMSSDGQES